MYVVLAGLLYLTICEIYVDDLIVYGWNEDDFIQNLRTIFERLVKYNCELKPTKCPFCWTKIEFVERVMFFDETIRKVLDFLIPTTFLQFSSFIGLVQYFRNYIYADYSSLLFLLQSITKLQYLLRPLISSINRPLKPHFREWGCQRYGGSL